MERKNEITYRISAIKSSTAYHPKGPYATLRHHPHKSFGAIYAWACKWSFTGIALSFQGGVMKPTLKFDWLGSRARGVLEVDVEE